MSACCHNYPSCKCEEEKVQCECGKLVPLSQAKMDDEACWYCPECYNEATDNTNPPSITE